MNLFKAQLQQLSKVAQQAAQQAGEYIASRASEDLQVNKKQGGDTLASQVVTEVDLAAQEIILNILQPTINEFDLGLLSEESVDNSSRFSRDFFWCVDPLDGTLSFIEGCEGYAVSIGLVSNSGDAIIGVVYNPVSKKMLTAIKGLGAFENGDELKMKPSQCFTFGTDRSFLQYPSFNTIVDELIGFAEKMGYTEFNLVQTSGAVMNACNVIDLAPACYFKFPKKENGGGSLWDFAASACIVNEAGGMGSDIFGHVLDLNRKGSTYMNHKGVLYASSIEIADFARQLFLKFPNKE